MSAAVEILDFFLFGTFEDASNLEKYHGHLNYVEIEFKQTS